MSSLPGSELRWPAAAALVVAAAAHVPVTQDHLSEVPYVGVLFVALEIACLAIGLGLVVARRPGLLRRLWAAAGVVCAAAVLGYVASRSVGLPGMPDDVGDWTNPLGLVSVATETLVVALSVAALRPRSLPEPLARNESVRTTSV